MRVGNLWDTLSCPGLEGRIRRPKRIDQNDWQNDSPSSLSEKGNKRSPHYQKQIPRPELYTEVDWPTEKMGTSFLPPGVEEAGRETGYDLVVQGKRRKV